MIGNRDVESVLLPSTFTFSGEWWRLGLAMFCLFAMEHGDRYLTCWEPHIHVNGYIEGKG